MFAHILDYKEGWFGIHPQCFIVNLLLWSEMGCPPVFQKVIDNTGSIQSLENVHDDYTPFYPCSKLETMKGTREIVGWLWIQKALEKKLKIENIPLSVRRRKFFIYPEQNSEILLKCLTEKNMDSVEKSILSDDQKRIIDHLSDESIGLRREMFLFNTETPPGKLESEKNLGNKPEKIDVFVGLPSGFIDFHILYKHGFYGNTHLIYFDVNQNILNFKQKLLELFDSDKSYPDFIEWIFDKYPEEFDKDILFTSSHEERKKNWEKELELWTGEDLFFNHLSKIKTLKREFIVLNLLEDYSPLIESMEKIKGKHVALWYSNCFNYTPGLFYKDWSCEEIKQQGVSFLNNILWLAEKNNLKITIYGENVLKGVKDSSGLDIHDVFN